MTGSFNVTFAAAVATLLAVSLATGASAGTIDAELSHNVTERFTYAMYPSLFSAAENYAIGQEVRVVVRATQNRVNSLFNRTRGSELRVRVQAAYANKSSTATGYMLPCNSSYSAIDVWAEASDFGTPNVYVFGTDMVRQASLTFPAPPFPFRVCFHYSPQKQESTLSTFHYQRRWMAGDYSDGRTVHRVNESSVYYYTQTSTINEGDFTGIAIARRSNAFPYAAVAPSPHLPSQGDSVKLVPAGYPCTYERRLARDNYTIGSDYCGTNMVRTAVDGFTGDAEGEWLSDHCSLEGSVTNGVGAVGTNTLNPLVSTDRIAGFPRRILSNETLMAYFKMPAAGEYDVCYSPLEYRRKLSRLRDNYMAPQWFKLLRANTSCASDDHTVYTTPMACAPNREARFTVSPRNTSTPTWSMEYTPRAGSWATIKVAGAGLNTMPATKFDMACVGESNCRHSREYYRTTGGDVLRLVRASTIDAADTAATAGRLGMQTSDERQRMLVSRAVGQHYGSEKMEVEMADTPALGTTAANAGCWSTDDDNYGLERGLPATHPSLCTATTCTESDAAPVTVSSDLGAAPSSSKTAANADADVTTEAHAYLRLPPTGSWYVCYRKAGVESWQVLPWNTAAAIPDARFVDNATKSATFLHIDGNRNGNVTFHLNDTRAMSWAPIEVRRHMGGLTTQPWNFYSAASAAATVGSALRLVPTSKGCDTSTPTIEVTDAGLHECVSPAAIASCFAGSSCSGCHGRLDDSTTSRSRVVFYAKLPFLTATDYSAWRVCFREAAGPWVELPKHNAAPSTDAFRFTTVQAARFAYSLPDRSVGSWGRIRLHSTEPSHTSSLIDTSAFDGTFGTVIRLAPNGTSCDVTWTGANPASDYNTSFITTDLGGECAQTSSSSTSWCYGRALNPRAGGVNATAPYFMLDSRDNRRFQTAASAFLTLPAVPTGHKGFTLCVKQGHLNWVPVQPALATVAPTPHVAMVDRHAAGTTFYAGAYDYVEVTAASGSITLDTAMVKLVPSTATCDRATVGTQGPQRLYESNTMATAYGAALVSAADTNVSTGDVPAARAYFTMPTTNDTAFDGTTAYRVCFIPRRVATANWVDLGSVSVRSVAIGWSAHHRLYHSGTFRVSVRALGTVLLNTTAGGDRLKIVAAASPCASNATLPAFLSSNHVGTRWSVAGTADVLDGGLADLGPTDLGITALATALDTLPEATGDAWYRVCYYPVRIGAWIELEELPLTSRVASIGTGGAFLAHSSGVTNVYIRETLMGNAPTIDATYGPANASFYAAAIAGVSTTFTSTSVDTSAAAYTTNHFFVTGTSLSTGDTLSIIRVASQRTLGVYDPTGVSTCDEGQLVERVTVDSTSNTSVATLSFDMPMSAGRYLLCYAPASSPGAAIVLPVVGGVSNATNPITVIEPQLYATIDTAAGTVAVKDLPSTLYPDARLGSLTITDYLYFTNFTGGNCGQSLHANGTAVGEMISPLDVADGNHSVGSMYNVMNVRDAAETLAGLPTGTFAVCYFKSTSNATTTEAALVPITREGTWYRIPVFTSADFQHVFRNNDAPTKLWARCVKNATAGVPFDVLVSVLDSNNNLTPQASSAPLAITASTGTGSWLFENAGGVCTPSTAPGFGIAASNPTIHTTSGEAAFRISVLSGCGTTGKCSLSFTSPGLTTSNACEIAVPDQPLAALAAESVPSTCYVGESCPMRFIARTVDGTNSFSHSGAAFVTLTKPDGLQFTIGGASATSGVAATFVAGVLSVDVSALIDESTVSQWFTTTGAQSVVVTVYNGAAASATAVSVTATFTVPRPTLTQIAIEDLWVTSWDGSAPTEGSALRTPAWEPSTTFGTHWDSSTTSASVASTVFPLVAGQYYAVRLRALDSRGKALPSGGLITSASTITLRFQDATATAGNVIIGQAPSLAESYSYQVPLSAVSFAGAVSSTVQFRLKTATGCTAATSGCRIAVLVGGRPLSPPTFIQSVVRAPATRLVAKCGAATTSTSTIPANMTTGACPGSTVQTGNFVELQAVDSFGSVDAFFTGTIYGVVGTPVAPSGIRAQPTRVSSLTVDRAWTSATMTGGVLRMNDFTLTQVCPTQLCDVTFFSDLAAGYATLTMNLTKSTTRIACAVNASRSYFVKTAANDGISARYSSGLIAQQSRILVYPDTDLCFVVQATDANQARTLYESIWAHWSARSPSGQRITATPSSMTPTRYRYMTRSQVEFCMRVSGPDGADFSVDFVAQAFGSNWAAGTGGRCRTPTFTLSTRRYIGALRIESTSGVTEMQAARSPGVTVWGYKQLTTTTESVPVIATFGLYDHYGKAIASNAIAAAHTNFAVVAGTCLPSDMSLGTCAQSTAATSTRSIAVTTPHSPSEGGMLRVAVTASNHAVTSAQQLSAQLAVSQWCLSCSITFRVSSTAGGYVDPALGAISVTLRMSLIIPPTVPSYVAFAVGNSPMMPTSLDRGGLLRSYWPHFVNSSGARPVAIGSAPVLIHRDCFANPTACPVTDTLFSHAQCSSDSPTAITGKNGAPMQLYVVRSSTALRFGEAWCNGDCRYQTGTVQSQADVFNSYTLSVSIGTQKLLCMSSTWCEGHGTTMVSRPLATSSASVEAILAQVHTNGIPKVSFALQGTDNSAAYNQDLSSNGVPAGTVPSVSGQFTVSAASVVSAVTAPVTLTSSHALGDDGGDYLLVWRGPQLVSSLAIRDVARDPACFNGTKYDYFTSPSTTASYNGYLTQRTLSTIAYNYGTTTAEVGVAFPVTVELRDAGGVISPGMGGTLTVSKHSWVGCNNGGTMTVTGGSTVAIVNGRATFWLTFSAPCAACRFSALVTHTAAQEALMGDLAFDDIKRQVVSKPIAVKARLANSATVVYATASTQTNIVSVSDLITATVNAYGRVGNMAVADTAASVELAAYNTIQTGIGASLWTVGNGGLLRPQNTAAAYGARHAVRALGTGGTATVSFSFQRTCAACTVTLAWKIVGTGATGTFTMQYAGAATVLEVTAPRRISVLAGYAPGTVRKYQAFTLTAWTASSDSTSGIEFAGFVPTTAPASGTPSLALLTDGNGDGGSLDSAVNRSSRAAIYHLRATASCDLCRFGLGSVSHQAVIATTATHYRIQSMTPRLIALGSPVIIEAYASDEDGFVDVTVGGQADCQYVDAFFCDQNALRLAVVASQTGRVASDFYPTSTFMTRGGPTQSTFALESGANFLITNGRTPAGGTTVTATGSPVSECRPIVSDANGLSSARYPTYAFSTDVGLTGVVLMNDRPGADAQVFQPFSVLVSFTKQTASGSARFMVSNANNTIRVDPSGECNYRLLNPSVYVKMVKGVANFTFVFTKKSVGGTCNPIFTSMTGNAACSDAPACRTTATIRAFELAATSWDFKRPSTFENDNASLVGPRFAVAGRTQLLNPQLLQITAFGVKEAMSCRSGCVVSVTSLSCSPAPTIIPSGGTSFNINGTATVRVAWPVLQTGSGTNVSLSSYACRLVGSATGGVDPPAVTTFDVSVCNPTRIALATNGSASDWNTGSLETGRAYPLDVTMLDNNGQLCRGDTQYGISSVLQVSVVDPDGQPVTGIDVINLNTSTSTAPGEPPQPYNNTAHLAAGRFRFRLVFSTSTSAANLTGGIRVRVTARSTTPLLNVQAFTPVIQVVRAERTLRWLEPPTAYVSRARAYSLNFIGTDAVPEEWQRQRNIQPQVGGASASVLLSVDPSFRRVLPIATSGSATSTGMVSIANGRSSAAFRFHAWAEDGAYNVSLAHPANVKDPAYATLPPPRRVVLQTPTSISLLSLTFRPNTTHACFRMCTLPDQAFSEVDGVLNTTQGDRFDMAAFVADPDGSPVLGETGLTISCRVVTPRADSTVILGEAPSLVNRGVISAPVVNGYANFSLGFMNLMSGVNGTLPANTTDLTSELVQLQCGCTGGLCPTGIPEVSSLPIRVRAINMTAELRTVLNNPVVIKAPTTLTALSSLDTRLVQSTIMDAFVSNGIGFVDDRNVDSLVQVTACLVDRDLFGFSDLYGTVCGTNAICSAAADPNCPNQVAQCTCPNAIISPAAARRMAARDARLMKARQLAAQDVQLEVVVSLADIPAYFPESAADAEAMYERLQRIAVDALGNATGPLVGLSIIADTILTKRGSGAPATAPPDPPTLPPLTPSPTSNSTTAISAAPGAGLTWSRLGLMLLAAFATTLAAML